jgi:hypothetical protein
MIINEMISSSQEKPVIDIIDSLSMRIVRAAANVNNTTKQNALIDKDETEELSFCAMALPTSL